MKRDRFPPVELVPKVCEKGEIKERGIVVNSMRIGENLVKYGIIPDPRKNFPIIREMRIFDDDILICAYQKAGTHWLWEIASMLCKQSTEYQTSQKDVMMLEFNDPEELENLARPRILNTHMIFEALPKGILEKRCKILYIQRNPKDLAMSCFHYISRMRGRNNGLLWEDFFHYTVTGQGEIYSFHSKIVVNMPCLPPYLNWYNMIHFYFYEPFVPWYKHLEGFEKELDDRHDHILHVPLFYDDIKKVPITEIKKISFFFNVDCSDDFAKEVAEKCCFKNLKEADKKKENIFAADVNFIFRKGEVGDWKNLYTVAQNAKTDELIADKMRNSRFKYKFTI